ncbi:MAG: uridine kinase [Bacteroidetes bacterium]|nr:MAG: uridine kinase [Bacteroidota bacterium]
MLIIGIAGGSGSGKTTVVKEIIKSLPKNSVAVVSQDAYYYDNGHLSKEEKLKINFDHPNSIEWDLLNQDLDQLRNGNSIEMPIYTYVTCGRSKETIPIVPKKVVIVEGILIFTNPELLKRLDVKVYVAADADERLMRIINRDMMERGRSLSAALSHYENFVRPMHLQFIEPTKRNADIIIPQGGENHVGIDILTSKIIASI